MGTRSVVIVVLGALFCSGAFADGDLCARNLEQMEQLMNTRGKEGINGARVNEFYALHDKAKKAQAVGDIKGCIAFTTQGLQISKRVGKK
ncbi:hypothetical protein N0Z92_30125 [Pseudomonas aeruginosa]|nr:hypothetical protein [Pseudomonas aeruginosa]